MATEFIVGPTGEMQPVDSPKVEKFVTAGEYKRLESEYLRLKERSKIREEELSKHEYFLQCQLSAIREEVLVRGIPLTPVKFSEIMTRVERTSGFWTNYGN